MLNKSDVFRSKLEKCPLSNSFHSYKGLLISPLLVLDVNLCLSLGANTFDEAAGYIRQKFEKLNHQERRVHTFYTCATDTDDVRLVWDRLVKHIQEEGLELASP
jgi:hypothetical protein